jgi:hypothetical protein
MAAMRRKRGRAWTIVERIGAVLSIILALIALAQFFDPIHDTTAEVLDALWPAWIVGVLLASVLGLIALNGNRERRLRTQKHELARVGEERDQSVEHAQVLTERDAPARHEHDERIVQQILTVMPRGSARFLAEHDFGASWDREEVMPVHALAEDLDEVEHRFLDPQLEAARRELIEDAQALARELGQHSARLRGPGNRFAPIPPLEMDMPPEGEAGERWQRAQALLNDRSTRVAEAYDRLLAAANEGLYL